MQGKTAPRDAPQVDVKKADPPSPHPRAGRRPTPPRKSIDAPSIDLGSIRNFQIVDENGNVPDPSLDPNLDAAELLKVYRAMVLTRKLDERMLAMQRQGEMGTFAPGYGQEATEIGQIYPLLDKDWFAPSYRSFGAQIWRGWPIEQLLLLWDGFFEGFPPPPGVNDLPFSIVIGSHPPVATGIAMAIRNTGGDGVVLTNFGDGAMSQGVVSESFIFAATFKAPIVFMLENNGYAISMPVQKQTATDHFAGRGPGFGMPSIRVDGNDVLAMIVATQQAVDRARRREGPTLIEAVTYRMSLHTTADDPRVYRSDEEVEYWTTRDPLRRFEIYLKNKGLIDDGRIQATVDDCDREVREAREAFRQRAKSNPGEIFDFLFETLPPELEAQKEEYLAKLKRKGVL